MSRLFCGVLAIASAGVAAQSPIVTVVCDAPPADVVLTMPASVLLPAERAGVLLIEERGDDFAIHRQRGDRSDKWDQAPSGRAFQAAEFDADATVQWILQPAVPATRQTRARIQAICSGAAWDLTGLRLLAQASADTARAEDADLSAEQRHAARAQSVATLSALAVVAQTSSVRRLWPWLAPQALQARAFAYSRMARPADSRNDLDAAAKGWREIGDGLRSATARHRAAQQRRREGDLVPAERALRELRSDPIVRADPTLVGVVTNDLCLTLRHLLRLREALRCYDDAVALHDKAGNVTEAALSRANRADAYAQLGRYAEADADAQAAQLQARQGGRTRAQLLSALVVGNIARAQGRLDAAIQAYLEALSLGERLQDANLRANALQQLGIAYLLLSDFARAQQFLGEAAEVYAAGGYANNAVIALRNLADAQRNAGLRDRAAATIARALVLIDAGKAGQAAVAELQLLRAEMALQDDDAPRLDEAIAAAQSALGDSPSYLHRQRLTIALAKRALRHDAPAAAEAGLREARGAARRADDVIGLVEIDALQARIEERRGRTDAARRHYQSALSRALRVAALQTYPLHRTSYLAQARHSLERLLVLSHAADPNGATAILDRFGAVAALQQASRSGERALAPANPQRAAVLAEVNERVRRRWGIQSSEELADTRLAATGVFSRAQQLDVQARATPPPPAAATLVAQWQAQLRDADSLRISFAGERQVFAWTLTGGQLSERVADSAPALRAAVTALQRAMRDLELTPVQAVAPAVAVRAAALLDHAAVGAGARHYLFADGPLADLPPVLLVAAPSDASTLPTVMRVLDLAAPLPGTACCSGLALQAFADPSVDAVSATTRSAASLPRLPGSRDEARTITARWSGAPTRLWLGAEFTRQRTLDALATRDTIVHFGTHGFASGDEPGLSALLVAADDARHGLDVVSFHDLLLVDVRARLVVLGACDTARGDMQTGGGASLARALLVAGAREVVAPLWSIDDAAANAFMRAFYDALGSGDTPAAAVAAAQSLLAQRPATAHPYYWAGFFVQRGAELSVGRLR